MYKIFILILALLSLSQSMNLVYYSALPVSRMALFKALLSMNYLKSDLDNTFSTQYENKYRYYIRTKLTEQYLTDVSNELKQYNNALIGSNNGVTGRNNLIVGDNNRVAGSENWVFSEGFNGQIDKDLIIDNWQVEVDKADYIPVDPRLAIRQW